MKTTPDKIVEKYWRCPWWFKLDGSLRIELPDGRCLVFKEEHYIPKNFRDGKK